MNVKISDISQHTKQSVQTLYNWRRNKPELFAIVEIGTRAAIKHTSTDGGYKNMYAGALWGKRDGDESVTVTTLCDGNETVIYATDKRGAKSMPTMRFIREYKPVYPID